VVGGYGGGALNKVLLVGATVLALTSCAKHAASSPTHAPEATMPLNRLSANDVADVITRSGLPMPGAHDVTAVKCPRLQCIGAIDSDTVSIVKFAQSGPAEHYAGGTFHSYVVADIVLMFGPTATPADRAGAERAVAWAAQH